MKPATMLAFTVAPLLWAAQAGDSELVERLMELALQRYDEKTHSQTTYYGGYEGLGGAWGEFIGMINSGAGSIYSLY